MAKGKPPKGPSEWANKPYKVGKGKPPVEHQFKAGQSRRRDRVALRARGPGTTSRNR